MISLVAGTARPTPRPLGTTPSPDRSTPATQRNHAGVPGRVSSISSYGSRRSTPQTVAHDQREHPESRSHQHFDLQLQVGGGSLDVLHPMSCIAHRVQSIVRCTRWTMCGIVTTARRWRAASRTGPARRGAWRRCRSGSTGRGAGGTPRRRDGGVRRPGAACAACAAPASSVPSTSVSGAASRSAPTAAARTPRSAPGRSAVGGRRLVRNPDTTIRPPNRSTR